MLKPTLNYENEIKEKLHNTWFNEKYKFYHCYTYYQDWIPLDNTYDEHQFVSVRNEDVIGFICYCIDRDNGDIAYNLGIINFEEEPSFTFAMDLGQCLKEIFEKFSFRKLIFTVIIGNPMEKTYDRLCEKYHGRIVGIKKEQCKLIDGKYYDEKIYEIMAVDYFAAKKEKSEKRKQLDRQAVSV